MAENLMHIHVNRLRYFTSNKSTLLHQELFQLAWLKFTKYGFYTLQLKNSTIRPNKLFLLKVAVRINKLCPVCEEPDRHFCKQAIFHLHLWGMELHAHSNQSVIMGNKYHTIYPIL